MHTARHAYQTAQALGDGFVELGHREAGRRLLKEQCGDGLIVIIVIITVVIKVYTEKNC
jgi:hypothetical protein